MAWTQSRSFNCVSNLIYELSAVEDDPAPLPSAPSVALNQLDTEHREGLEYETSCGAEGTRTPDPLDANAVPDVKP